MSVTAFASGTQASTVGTENFLSSPNVAGVFTLHVDCVNMAAGDVLELRVYQLVLSTGTSHVAYIGVYQGVQSTDDTVKISIPIGNDLTSSNSLRFSLKQTFGTSRNYDWKVLQY